MSNTSQFQKVPIEVQNRNGFDCSFETCGTAHVGTLVPVAIDEIFPNDKFSIGVTSEVELPPMATNFFGRVDICFEAFFVPYRIIYGGWKKFYTQKNGDSISLPKLSIGDIDCKPGSLLDYLGKSLYMPSTYTPGYESIYKGLNLLAPAAYQKIYDDWYRDSRIQNPLFVDSDTSTAVARLPFTQFDGKYFGDLAHTVQTGVNKTYEFDDGSNVLTLRQRNYAKDYFTTATTDPQSGVAASVQMEVENIWDFNEGAPELPTEETYGDVTGKTSFTIAALRSANAIQRFLERHNIAGDRYPDRILGDWGCLPSDAITDRAIYLGQVKNNVVCHSVISPISQSAPSAATGNPFASSAGSTAGRSSAFAQGHLGTFHSKEHGFLMVLMSLVPHAYYGTGTRRYLMAEQYRSFLPDFPNPLLCGVGDQPIDVHELDGDVIDEYHPTFGYTQRFAETKFIPDSVHGLLVDGQSLSNFALKRSFAEEVPEELQISTSFLEIPKTALDDVTAVASSLSTYGYKYDCGFSYKKSSCMPAYCIPTLDREHDVHTLLVDNGGRRL